MEFAENEICIKSIFVNFLVITSKEIITFSLNINNSFKQRKFRKNGFLLANYRTESVVNFFLKFAFINFSNSKTKA